MADIATLGVRVDGSQLHAFNRTLSDTEKRGNAVERSMQRMGSQIRTALAAAGIGLGIREVIEYADSWKSVESSLRLVTTSTAGLRTIQNELFEVAQRTRSSYESTATLYARVARNSAELGVSQRQLLQFTEAVQKAIKLGGGNTQESTAGVIQLSQALASGVLRGDEFRSVMENMPGLARAMAEGLGVPIGKLREMANAGELTSDKVIRSVLSMRQRIDQDFQSVALTVGDAFTILRNEVLKFIGLMDSSTGAGKGAAEGIIALSKNIGTLAAVLGAAAAAWITYKAAAIGAAAITAVLAGAGTVRAFLSLALAVRKTADAMALLSLVGSGLKGVVATVAAIGAGFGAYLLISQQITEATENFRKELEKLSGEDRDIKPPPGLSKEFQERSAVMAGELAKQDALNDAFHKTELELKTLEILYDAAIENSKLAGDFKGRELAALIRLNNATADAKIRTLELAEAKEAEGDARERNNKAAEKDLELALRIINANADAADAHRAQLFDKTFSGGRSLETATRDSVKESIDIVTKGATEAAERQKQIMENLIRSMQQGFSDFFVGIFNGGINSFRKLFDHVKQLYLKLLADMLAAKIVVKVFGDRSVGTQQILAGNIMKEASLNMLAAANIFAGKTPPSGGATPPGAAAGSPWLARAGAGVAGFGIGYGIGQATGDRFEGGLGGALGGAAAGFAIAGPLGAVIGGLTGLAGGLLGASKAAREAAEQLKEMRKAVDANIASFHAAATGTAGSVEEQIKQVKANADRLRTETREAFGGTTGAWWNPDIGNNPEYASRMEQITADEAAYIALLRQEAALKAGMYREDLQVRLLRAQGNDAEADRLAQQLAQQREMAELIKSGADAATIALLGQVHAAEALKKIVDDFSTSVRNAPSGFKVTDYIQRFAIARTGPFSPPPLNIPYSPIRPGMPTTTASPARVVNNTWELHNIRFEITGNTGPELLKEVAVELDRLGARTVGINVSRAEALDYV